MIDLNSIICGYEWEIVHWIKDNYKKLGYDKIIEINDRKCPDFVMLRGGKKIRVEVEIYSSYFVKHKHSFDDVDEVLCLVNDKELSVKVIKIPHLKLWYQLKADDRVDFLLDCPDRILVNHKTGERFHHFQDEWLKLSNERINQIKKNFKEVDFYWARFR